MGVTNSRAADPRAPRTTVGATLLDWSRYPVCIVTPPPRPVTDKELREFLDHFVVTEKLYEPPCAMVLDLREAAPMPPAQRRILTDLMNNSDAGLRRYAASALVFRSAIMRGFLTAMLWMFRPPYPTRVFEDLGEAIAWAREQSDLARSSKERPVARHSA